MNRRTFIELAAGISASPFLSHERVHPTRPAYSINDEPSEAIIQPQSIFPAWHLGTLDPCRTTRWPKDVGLTLEHVPIAPVYASLIFQGEPHSPSDYEDFQIFSSEGVRKEPADEIYIRPRPERPSVTLFLDFGRTMPGYLEFDAEPLVNTMATVQFGEAMQPTRTYTVKQVTEGGSRFRTEIPHGEWGSLRFAWIHLPNLQQAVTVRNIRAMYQVFPSDYIGDFHSSDTALNLIWEMCAYSAHAVMAQPEESDPHPQQDLQTLCLDRIDRIPWAGDSRVIQTVVEYCFGQYELLRVALEKQLPAGTRPIPDLQTIPPYTLDWALALMDYYQVSGDSAYLKSRLSDVDAIIRKYQNGPTPNGWMFFDWDPRIIDPARTAAEQPEPLRQQASFAFTGKYAELCRVAAQAVRSIGEMKTASAWDEIADTKARNWRQSHPAWQQECGIHAITQLLLGGVLGPGDWHEAWLRVYADRQRRWTNTPFFGFYVLRALALIGRHDAAVEMIQDYWGSMINAGATTTWEEWSPTTFLPRNAQPPQYGPPYTWGGLSLIQPSGSGPANWLMSELAGIKPRSPGFRTVQLAIRRFRLEELRATVASPFGPISVHRRQNSSRIEITYDVPRSCEGVFLLLPHGRKYRLDNKQLRPEEAPSGELTAEAPCGTHTCEITI